MLNERLRSPGAVPLRQEVTFVLSCVYGLTDSNALADTLFHVFPIILKCKKAGLSPQFMDEEIMIHKVK